MATPLIHCRRTILYPYDMRLLTILVTLVPFRWLPLVEDRILMRFLFSFSVLSLRSTVQIAQLCVRTFFSFFIPFLYEFSSVSGAGAGHTDFIANWLRENERERSPQRNAHLFGLCDVQNAKGVRRIIYSG